MSPPGTVFGGKVIPTKKSAMDLYFRSNLQHLQEQTIDVVLQVIVRNIIFKARSYGLQL